MQHVAFTRERNEPLKKQNLSPRFVAMENMKKTKKMIVEAEKQKLEKCFTCPLCNNLFDCATTISECLHTFCRKCIHEKLIGEDLKACPVCNVDLGVAPLDKLRTDNNLEDMRLKLFRPKPETVKEATETIAESLQSSSKKDKSLFSPESNPDAPFDLNEQLEDVPQIWNSSRPILKFRKRQRKNPRPIRIDKGLELEQLHMEGELDFQIVLNIEQENGLTLARTSEGYIQKGNNSKKDNEEIPISFGDMCNTEEVTVEVTQDTVFVSSDRDTEEVSDEKLKNNGKENQEHVLSSEKISGEKPKGKQYSPPVLRPRRWRTMNLTNTPQDHAIDPEDKVEESNNPVWFSLIAAENQNTNRPLPQISPRYLRVTNGNLPVSYVKKYLVKKLSLKSENEVEILLRQEPVSSTQRLHNLVDWWVQTTPVDERKSATVESSGAEFVMVLFYSRSHLYH